MTEHKQRRFSEIVVIEPDKTKYSHSIFNASLLCSLRIAFPATPIRFHCHKSHVPWVINALESSKSSCGISFCVEPIPPMPVNKWRRLREEWCLYRGLQRRYCGKSILLVFSSISPGGLLALNLRLPFVIFGSRPTIAIIHCLQLLTKRSTRLRHLPFDLNRILRLPTRRDFRLIALGDSVLKQARQATGRHFKCESIHIPRLEPEKRRSTRKDPRPTFVFIGGTAKGFDLFHAISRVLHNHDAHPRFLLAGHVNSDLADDIEQFVEGITRQPLSQQELEFRIASAHYVIWTANPEVYKLTASATFADAMCFGVPIIALRNDYMEHYFERFGRAGVLCDNEASMIQAVSRILNRWPDAESKLHSQAARRLYNVNAPSSVATQVTAISDSLLTSARS